MNDLMKWVCVWTSEDDGRKKSSEGRSKVSSEKRGAKARQERTSEREAAVTSLTCTRLGLRRRACAGKGKGKGERELQENTWIA